MDCPNCGTWNPEDKIYCWRCQAELPKPEEKKKRKPLTVFGIPAWIIVVGIIALMLPFFMQCGPGLLPG